LRRRHDIWMRLRDVERLLARIEQLCLLLNGRRYTFSMRLTSTRLSRASEPSGPARRWRHRSSGRCAQRRAARSSTSGSAAS
jgi:hypothetical protein